MINRLYLGEKRLVGIDIWRGAAIIIALLIHYSFIADLPILGVLGDFFSGYFSVGVVFVGVAGMMGWLKYGNEVERNFQKVLSKHWRKAGELVGIYWGYILLIRTIRGDQINGIKSFWLGDPYFLGIFLVLAAVYFVAPFLLWLYKKTGEGWTLLLWSVFWFGLATWLISQTSGPSFWADLWFNHWRNTVPILPMLAVYTLGAWVAWGYKTKKLTLKWQRLAWIAILLYPFFRYGLNNLDFYPNNLFWVRALMFVVVAMAAIAYKPGKQFGSILRWLAYIGAGSFWVFIAGNLQIALLPHKPVISSGPIIWQWLLLLLIIVLSVMVLVGWTLCQGNKRGKQ